MMCFFYFLLVVPSSEKEIHSGVMTPLYVRWVTVWLLQGGIDKLVVQLKLSYSDRLTISKLSSELGQCTGGTQSIHSGAVVYTTQSHRVYLLSCEWLMLNKVLHGDDIYFKHVGEEAIYALLVCIVIDFQSSDCFRYHWHIYSVLWPLVDFKMHSKDLLVSHSTYTPI